MNEKRKIIGVVVDAPDWAFANIALEIKRHVSPSIEIQILTLSLFGHSLARALIALSHCDLIHILPRQYLLRGLTADDLKYLAEIGSNPKKFKKEFLDSKKITLGVYDHQETSARDIARLLKKFNSLAGFTVSNLKLFEIYSKVKDLKRPSILIQDGVDLDKFKHNYKINTSQDHLVVGWVGNSNWGGSNDHKGLHTIVLPAINLLKSKNLNVLTNFADKSVKIIRHSEMPNFYKSIDVLVCASLNEGTPNPILEAMASGVPIVTTDVGIAREAFGPKQSEYILDTRSSELFAEKLSVLFDPEIRQELSLENKKYVESWTWETKAKLFEDFFLSCLGP